MTKHGFALPLALLVCAAWLVGAIVGLAWPESGWLCRAFANDAAALLLIVVASLALGVPLGALGGSGPKFVDSILGFLTDWTSALPAVLLLACLRPLAAGESSGLWLLVAIRTLEVAWVVRSALLRAAARDDAWAPRSLGYMPLAVFATRRLPAAFRPALGHLSVTPLWTLLLDSAGAAAGLGVATSEAGFGAVLASPASTPAQRGACVLATAALAAALHWLGERVARRLDPPAS